MFSLREYRNTADRLADFLPWTALVAPGVVLNKDGSFQRSARFRGPDLDSATPSGERRRTTPKATFPIRPRRWSSASAPPNLLRKVPISKALII